VPSLFGERGSVFADNGCGEAKWCWVIRVAAGESVEGASDRERAAVEDVGVDHGGGDIPMAEELLDGADVVASIQQVGGEAVPQAVAACLFGEARRAHGVVEGALEDGFVKVVTEEPSGVPVTVFARRRKDPLPPPRAARFWILSRQGAGEHDQAATGRDRRIMALAHRSEMGSKRHPQQLGKEGPSIPPTFAVADDDVARPEIDVFDPEARAFENAKSRAIQ
jgi:hypothetical protein